MKSFKLISLVTVIFISVLSVSPSLAAAPEALFIHTKISDYKDFEKLSDNLVDTEGIIDSYFNNDSGLLTVIYDRELLNDEDIFDYFRKSGYKINKYPIGSISKQNSSIDKKQNRSRKTIFRT
jgi:hypothetical protein